MSKKKSEGERRDEEKRGDRLKEGEEKQEGLMKKNTKEETVRDAVRERKMNKKEGLGKLQENT